MESHVYIGFAVLVVGAVVTFGSNFLTKKLFHKEKPKETFQSLVIKFIGLGIAIAGMLIATSK